MIIFKLNVLMHTEIMHSIFKLQHLVMLNCSLNVAEEKKRAHPGMFFQIPFLYQT